MTRLAIRDFIGQVIGSLRAAETAVLTISATAGIEVNTRRTFARAGDEGIGRIIVINKCDADNIDFPALVDQIQEMFGQGCVPLNVPVGLGGDFSGVCSTLTVPDSVPGGAVMNPSEVNSTLMDAIAEADEDLMERYLEGEELSPDEVAGGVTKAIVEGTLIPILCVSSRSGTGVPELMDAIASFAPSPVDLPRTAKNADGEDVPVEPKSDGPLIAQVFKTRIDPFVAKMSFIRVFSGSLGKDSAVQVTGGGKALKLSQPMSVQGGKQDPIDSAGAGEIVAVVKMEELKTGDTLTKGADGVSLPSIPFPTPMIALAVEPKSRADQSKISGALAKIEDEDSTFRIYRDPQTKEMVMQGMSELHLQIAQGRLQKRDKVEVVTHQPKVPYRETVNGAAEGHYRHKKQSGGAGQFAEVHFRISQCPANVNPEEFFTKANFESPAGIPLRSETELLLYRPGYRRVGPQQLYSGR